MKKSKVLLKICLIIITIVIISSSVVYAGFIDNARGWIGMGNAPGGPDFSEATTGFRQIAGFLQGIGILIIAIVGAVIGIKYMLGSVEEKAEHKKLLVPYLIGSVIIIAALTIWRILIDVFNPLAI